METKIIIQATNTKEYYKLFESIRKKMNSFPKALEKELLKTLERNYYGNAPLVKGCKFLHVANRSDFEENKWIPKANLKTQYKKLNKETMLAFIDRLECYVRKCNYDALMFTIERIRNGNRARTTRSWREINEEDRRERIENGEKVQNEKKHDFYSMGGGFVMNEDDKKFLFDFCKKYFELVEN